ncbi:uncharacterized, partial [Tachysurus ichikawai]
ELAICQKSLTAIPANAQWVGMQQPHHTVQSADRAENAIRMQTEQEAGQGGGKMRVRGVRGGGLIPILTPYCPSDSEQH